MLEPISTDGASEAASTSSQQDLLQQSEPTDQAGESSKSDTSSTVTTRAQVTIETWKPTRRRHKKATSEVLDEDDEPVIDQTEVLPLHSKKTERLQRKQRKKSEKPVTTLLSLPSELLSEIFSHLLPTEIPSLLLTNHAVHSVVSSLESTIARNIVRRRYWVLQRCFTLPIPLSSVPQDIQSALLSPQRQDTSNIHRRYYLHVQTADPHEICTCLTCVFAWNNLCLITDLHHWQPHLENREPLPFFSRGDNPQWNRNLLRRNADLVRTAIARPIVYARILQMHLDTITLTLRRTGYQRAAKGFTRTPARPRTQPHLVASTPLLTSPDLNQRSVRTLAANPSATTDLKTFLSSLSPARPRPYQLTIYDVMDGTDVFLERNGPSTYDFPYMRDIYYSLEAYLPNRWWNKEKRQWVYNHNPMAQHLKDVEWVKMWAERQNATSTILNEGSAFQSSPPAHIE